MSASVPAAPAARRLLAETALERPGLRDLARLARRYPREHFYLAGVPVALQRLLLRRL